MKIKSWTIALAALFITGQASAAESTDIWSTANVNQVCYSSSDCGCGDTTGDCGCDSDVGCSSSISCGSVFENLFGDCCNGSPWRLQDEIAPCSSFKFGGWLQFGVHDKYTPLSTAVSRGLSFNDTPDKLNLHQAWAYFEKEANPSCTGWDWGYRIDALYGIDAQDAQSFGNDSNRWDASFDHGNYGLAIPQAYVEFANQDWSIIAGRFFAIAGYEVIPATGNFFYSHSLTMYNSEPFGHTGMLATYKGIDGTEVYAGYTYGWDSGFDQYSINGQNGSSFLGGFSRDLSSDVNFTYITSFGDLGWRGDGYSHSMVLDVQLTSCVNYVIQSDITSTNAVTGGVAKENTVGINQYLFYQYSNCLELGTRLEWWKRNGVSHNEFTVGANYKVNSNIIIRPEIRHDWSPVVGTDQTNLGIDAIFTF